ncbi:type II secretion system protein [Candidatus Uhrbacteria bacterium]|nr:type II secretion system protein [Candidatus Uhrbacteria bacterium]
MFTKKRKNARTQGRKNCSFVLPFFSSSVPRGFTLIEILVSLGIFIIAIGILGQIFSAVMRTQRVILTQQKLIEEARNILDTLVDEVRRGSIDYQAYGAASPSTSDILRLIGRDGTLMVTRSTDATACGFGGDVSCILVRRGNGSVGVMTSPAVYVTSLQFLIDPPRDPFTVDPGTLLYPTNIQPRVTIILTIDSGDPVFRGSMPLTVQTSVTTRTYQR